MGSYIGAGSGDQLCRQPDGFGPLPVQDSLPVQPRLRSLRRSRRSRRGRRKHGGRRQGHGRSAARWVRGGGPGAGDERVPDSRGHGLPLGRGLSGGLRHRPSRPRTPGAAPEGADSAGTRGRRERRPRVRRGWQTPRSHRAGDGGERPKPRGRPRARRGPSPPVRQRGRQGQGPGAYRRRWCRRRLRPVGGDVFDASLRCVAWEGRYWS